MASCRQPAVIFVDEIDSLVSGMLLPWPIKAPFNIYCCNRFRFDLLSMKISLINLIHVTCCSECQMVTSMKHLDVSRHNFLSKWKALTVVTSKSWLLVFVEQYTLNFFLLIFLIYFIFISLTVSFVQ